MRLLWLIAALVLPGPAVSGPVADALAAQLASPAPLAGQALYLPDVVQVLYAGRDHAPLWVAQQADAARDVLAGAGAHGLQAADYHLAAIDALRGDPSPAGQAVRDVLLSDGLLLFGSHVRAGKVAVGGLTPRWQLLAGDADLPDRLQRASSAGAFVDDLVSGLAGYPRLMQALAQYRGLAKGGGWPSLPDGPTLRLGDDAPVMAVLRERLAREDMDGASNDGRTLFDAPLEAAVRRFQARHGLDVDGAVGPQTRRAVNTPARARVDQIVANLERRRWLGAAPGRRQVRVNVAAFTLDAIDGPAVTLSMRVIVGRPYRPSPEFSDRIRYLVLNPFWEVPSRLADQDKLPLIRRDPGYLAGEHIRMLQGWGEHPREIDPASVDWQRVGRSLPYRLRQDPGSWNALGRIKFMFPNSHDVYLHDTPARALFAHAERGFSSGCIRVQDALALADWLLADDPRWSPERLRAAVEGGQTRTVNLREPVPVHLLYWTAWAGSDAMVHFRRDIYDRDAPLAAALGAAAAVH